MKQFGLWTAAVLTAAAFAAPADAAVIFYQDFNAPLLRGPSDGVATSDRFGPTEYFNTRDTATATFSGYTHIAVDAAGTNGALHLNETANGRSGGIATLVADLDANTRYTLSFLLSGDNVPGAAYDFIASIAGATFTTPGVVGTAGSNPGQLYSYSFTTTGAGPYSLTLSQSVLPGSAGSPIVDDVTISTAVPEPATWGMMLLGFGLVGFGMRRRRSAVRTAVRFG